MDKYIGKVLDNRYEILQVIGTGGMAVVYKALCHRLNRLVAVKILKDEFLKDDEFRNRFHAESQAVAMLSHPNIVGVYDVSRSKNSEYIVMELIDGITLKQYMERKGAMSWKEAQHFVCQILKALDHAHSKGIIHRDIKPHNIMVLRDGTIKVADFGIARFAAEQGTLTNEALGSVHYISPEQARGRRLDARADIYSTGVMLYEMLTAKLPYDGDTPVSVAIQHINSKAKSPREIIPDIPEAIEKITMKAMCKDIEKRYPTAEHMLQDLEDFKKNPKIVIDFEPLTQEEIDKEYMENNSVDKPKKILDEEWDDDDGKENFWQKYGSKVIIGAAVLLFLLGFYTLVSAIFGGGSDDTVAPKLVGLDIKEVLQDEEYEMFSIKEVERKFSKEYDEGEIISQSPEAGKPVKEGSEIAVVVSSGTKEVEIPDVHNMTEKQAKIELETRLNLEVKIKYEKSDEILSGYVIKTKPEAGESISEGETITVYVSEGVEIEKIKMPEIIGLSEAKAKQEIVDAGLKVGKITEKESDKKKGTVIEQGIEVDTEVEKDTEVDIVVSSGKAEKVPEKEPEKQPEKEPEKQPEKEPEKQPEKEPEKQPEKEPEKEPEKPVDTMKSKTIPVKLPASPESFSVVVKVNGSEVYNATHKASEGTANITVKGSGTLPVEVYIDGKLHFQSNITF